MQEVGQAHAAAQVVAKEEEAASPILVRKHQSQEPLPLPARHRTARRLEGEEGLVK